MKKRETIFWAIAVILAVAAIYITFTTYIGFSGFAAGFGKLIIAALFFYAFDKHMLKEIDTITEIKKGNIAYAIFILSYAIIIAACISTA